MIAINILEGNDILQGDDWCRPLAIESMSGGQSDHYSFRSMYTGCPENNAEWVRVKCVIGKCWIGKPVIQFIRRGFKYEFVRGEIPKAHQLNMKGYSDLSKMSEFPEDVDDDIPF